MSRVRGERGSRGVTCARRHAAQAAATAVAEVMARAQSTYSLRTVYVTVYVRIVGRLPVYVKPRLEVNTETL